PYVHTTTPSHTPDGVHPRELGHDTISAVVYRGMLPGLTAVRAGTPGTRRSSAKARLMPVPSGAAGNGSRAGSALYTLDGKAVPASSRSPAAGIYPAKPLPARD